MWKLNFNQISINIPFLYPLFRNTINNEVKRHRIKICCQRSLSASRAFVLEETYTSQGLEFFFFFFFFKWVKLSTIP